MKEIYKYNRPLAIAALVLVIVITVFADANFALISEKKDVSNAYKDGSLKNSVLKCADEAGLMFSAAENAGYNVSRSAKEHVENLRSKASSPIRLENALVDVYTDAIAIYEQNVSDNTVQKHYNELGKVLDALASKSDYNEAAGDYNDVQSGLLCGLLAPWFGKTADFASVYERFRTNFNLPSEPPSSDDGGIGDWISDHWFLTLVILIGLGIAAKVEKK